MNFESKIMLKLNPFDLPPKTIIDYTTELLAQVQAMRHSPAFNYVIPGLTSWLIGTPHPEMGCVRMFSCSREHEEPILPHSHRFNFKCLVLAGSARNRIWQEDPHGDCYEVSDVTYEGLLGVHTKTPVSRNYYSYTESTYEEGDPYGMLASEFHSIYFSKGAEVLFFEGPPQATHSQILEPVVNGRTIPLFRTDPWMFSRD
jgi:hypothetical protein